MTRRQVRWLYHGQPCSSSDTFHANRWDHLLQHPAGRRSSPAGARVSLFFNE
ncbi:hypothetical protein ACPA9J_21385 [Pseudomonas aeruginosa]